MSVSCGIWGTGGGSSVGRVIDMPRSRTTRKSSKFNKRFVARPQRGWLMCIVLLLLVLFPEDSSGRAGRQAAMSCGSSILSYYNPTKCVSVRSQVDSKNYSVVYLFLGRSRTSKGLSPTSRSGVYRYKYNSVSCEFLDSFSELQSLVLRGRVGTGNYPCNVLT